MKTIKMLAAAAVLALATAPVAHAAVLASAPALAAYPSLQIVYCDIVNLDKVPRNVTIDIVDYFGNVIGTSGSQTVLPSQGNAFGDGSGNGAWCRFTVDGSAKKYRAMAVYDNGSAYTVSVPAY
jgi:hypothetical protein